MQSELKEMNVFGIRACEYQFFIKTGSENPLQFFDGMNYGKRNKTISFEQTHSECYVAGDSTRRHTWLTEGLHAEFDTFIPMGQRRHEKARWQVVVFKTYSNAGFSTGDDGFQFQFLKRNVQRNL